MSDQVISADCTTVIGGDVTIKGEVTVEKGLRIDGRIEGSVKTEGQVLIGKSGELEAEIQAGTVIIEGKVMGNITATDRVQIDAPGQVHGDLTAPKLTMNEGATFVGKLNVGPNSKDDLRDVEEALPASLASRMNSLAATTAGGNGDDL